MLAGMMAIKKSMVEPVDPEPVKPEPTCIITSGGIPKKSYKSSASAATKKLVLALISKNNGITNNEIALILCMSKRHTALTTSTLFDAGQINHKVVSSGGRFGTFIHYINRGDKC